jgi:hypothetical protein
MLTLVAIYLIVRAKLFSGLGAVALNAWHVDAHAVSASRFVLVDAKGKTRAYLGFATRSSDEPGPRLVLYNAQGKARLALRVMDKDDSTLVKFYSGITPLERVEVKLRQDGISARIVDAEGDEVWSTPAPKKPVE